MADAVPERTLAPQWAPELVALSVLVSWLGAYTSTQIMIHAKYTRSVALRWVWTFFASFAFGFCAIWSMHFVGMLACKLDVEVHFNIPMTILSALVAVAFTFAALSTPFATEAVENSAPVKLLTSWNHLFCTALSRLCFGRHQGDVEAGYTPLSQHDGLEQRVVPSVVESVVGNGDMGSEDSSDSEDVQPAVVRAATNDIETGLSPQDSPSRRSSFTAPNHPDKVGPRTARSRPQTTAPRPATPMLSRASMDSSPSSSASTSSSSDSSSLTHDLSSTTLTTSSSNSWNEPLRHGLSRETRLRIRARAKERPVPHFGFWYYATAYYKSVTPFLFIRAIVWAAAIVFMHYCGMWAMEIPEGRISWDMRIVALSYAVAFAVCFVGCLAMNHMESHFGQQVVFSTIAAAGCCSMHYTGMAAATFYTSAPPSPKAGYPAFLPFTIVGVAVLVCVLSSALLAHAALTARNRMAEMILTKRRLWRIMAEKEAAEQAIELKQQFISVASHEIRTPLHTVNGYCELLGRTALTEEQAMYVTSIQQACHAINVIAGNVLDFSKLDRNNVELSARPVLMELRKMIEDIAKITEARGMQPGSPQVDVIVWVAEDVPQFVYLDETYAFRILMNLLSNAQKFCEQGYICLSVTMSGPAQLRIKVADTGCGIPKAFRSAIFEPFRQADTSLTRPKQGTGLGLSIVKHLVQRMSGTIAVDSVEGEGSTFTVELPVTLQSRSASPSPACSLPGSVHAKKRIRVVYRDARTQEEYVRLWTAYGYPACAGAHTASAAELAEGVDAIWTDAETVARSPALRALMGPSPTPASPAPSLASDVSASLFPPPGSTSRPGVVLFVVHSDSADLAPLEPALNDGRNVALVKRPVIMHTAAAWVDTPAVVAGTHIRTTRVRFALPVEVPDEILSLGSEVVEEGDVETEKAEVDGVVVPPPAMREKAPLRVEVTVPPRRGKEREKEGVAIEIIPVSPSTSGLEEARPKVILVEDNLINQRLGCRLLGKLGYEVATANDGRQAIDAIHETEFVCCLMDCQMPVLDGFQATKQIREMERSGVLPGHLPIIALTANVTQESEGECKAAGMDHFLPKPLKMNDLDDVLRRLRRAPTNTPHR